MKFIISKDKKLPQRKIFCVGLYFICAYSPEEAVDLYLKYYCEHVGPENGNWTDREYCLSIVKEYTNTFGGILISNAVYRVGDITERIYGVFAETRFGVQTNFIFISGCSL